MKAEQLNKIQDWTAKHYQFNWENLYKLSKRELDFFLGMLHKSYVQEKCLLKLVGGDTSRVEELIEEIIKEEGWSVREEKISVEE
jgi:hypothetical protein